MPEFRYTALDINGRKKRGVVNAADIQAVKSCLDNENLFMLSADTTAVRKSGRKLSYMELSDFCREINALISAGVNLSKAVTIIMNRDISKNLKNSFSLINSCLKKGIPLSEAMQQQNVFPELMINMIKAGETSGKLDETTLSLANLYEHKHRLDVKIKTALAYPVALLFMTVVIMILIFTFVLPKFFKLFGDIQLPASTRAVMAVSSLFTEHTAAVAAVAFIIIAAVIYAFKNPKSRYIIDRLMLKIPKAGKLIKIICTSRFAASLCSLYSGGIPVVTAVITAGNTVGNSYISSQVTDAARKIRSGNTLSSSVSEIDGFDSRLADSIAIGEESGKTDTLLSSLADSYSYEAETAVSKLVSFIEPVMICIMGAMVAFAVISVMQPIYLLYSQIR